MATFSRSIGSAPSRDPFAGAILPLVEVEEGVSWRARNAPARPPSEALQRALARVGDLEERVELRQLEQRLEVVVQVRQPQLAPLLADLLRERHQHAEARAVDVARLAEVDQELPLAALQLVEDLLLELLSVPDNEL